MDANQDSTFKSKALHGIAWSAIDKIANKGINFLIGIIIARILSPSDYGVIGMVMVFITLSSIFVDSGFTQALVQKKERSQTDMSTAFFFNILISIACYTLLFAAAPLIARFYEMPILVKVLRVLGLNVIIMAFGTVQRANLLININFKTLAIVDLLSVTISGGVGIGMAYGGFGVWALVAQMILTQISTAAGLWILGRWRPLFEFSKASVRRLWKFGSKLLTAGVVSTVTREINSIVIGKFYRSAELGYYHRAVQTTDMISTTLYEIINTSTFPILSSIQDERDRLISVYSRMLSMTAFIVLPVMTLLAIVANPLVQILLTDKWLPAVPLIQWLCFARMFTPISALNMNILNVIGRSDLFLKVDLSKLPLLIVMMLITLPISVRAVVIGNFIFAFICYFINAYMPGRLFDFGIRAQFQIFYRILIATAIMAGAAIGVMYFIETPHWKLLAGGATGLLAYFIAGKCLRLAELEECIALVKKTTGKKRL